MRHKAQTLTHLLSCCPQFSTLLDDENLQWDTEWSVAFLQLIDKCQAIVLGNPRTPLIRDVDSVLVIPSYASEIWIRN